jgi:ribosomal protein S4E
LFFESKFPADAQRLCGEGLRWPELNPLAVLCRYALTGAEVNAILMQRNVKVDGKVRTDATYPTGLMDVVSLPKTGEHFRLVFDTKGRFVVHRISPEEASYKLCKVRRNQFGKGGVPYIATHDGRTIRYPDPEIKVQKALQLRVVACILPCSKLDVVRVGVEERITFCYGKNGGDRTLAAEPLVELDVLFLRSTGERHCHVGH